MTGIRFVTDEKGRKVGGAGALQELGMREFRIYFRGL